MMRRAAALLAVLVAGSVVVPSAGDGAGVSAAGIQGGRVRQRLQPVDGKVFVLVIGNDARSGNPNQSRADALHIVGFNTKTMRGGILNFPRDSYVDIPGRGRGRINEALFRGGPQLQARTVEALTGIRLDYWIMTGFEGFRKIMRDVGPIRYKFRRAIYDPGGSGINMKAGVRKLPPETALSFVRTRKAMPNGDIDRTTNQARFMLAMLRKLQRDVDRNPVRLLNWVATLGNNTRLDLRADDLFRLGVLATQVKPGRVGMRTVPVSLGTVGAASVVFIRPEAGSIYRRFKRTAAL